MLTSIPTLRVPLVAAFAALLLAGCGGKGLNSAPRIASVPDQSVGAGAVLNLDLATFVVDKENDVLTWSVVAGGGAFAGATYTNTFATMGTYPVTVRATDVSGKQADASFSVMVTQANLAVVGEGDDLRLLDADTLNFLDVTASDGVTDALRATLARGPVVYTRTSGGNVDLYAFDPYTRVTTTLGAAADENENHVAKTSDHKVVFGRTHATTGDGDLFLWDSVTNTARTISADPTQDETNALVSSENLVYFQRADGGQYDLWYYDPATDTSTAFAASTRNEVLRAVVPGGGVVFTRVGDGGELDLFFFQKGTGVVEIGADLAAPMPAQTKTWAGFTSGGKVVFEVTGVSEIDVCVWNPATGASRVVSGADAGDARFRAANSLDAFVYSIAASPTDANLAYYDYATNVRTVFESTASNATWKAVCTTGEVVFEVAAASRDLLIFDPATLSNVVTLATGTDETFLALLANDTIAFTRGGTGLLTSNKTATTVVTVQAGVATDYSFGIALLEPGDFVFQVMTGGQSDLWVWDASATTASAISTHGGPELAAAEVGAGRVLFTRVETGSSTSDLFLWTRASNTITRLTTSTENHFVPAYFTANRN
jgi:hypothetical protein